MLDLNLGSKVAFVLYTFFLVPSLFSFQPKITHGRSSLSKKVSGLHLVFLCTNANKNILFLFVLTLRIIHDLCHRRKVNSSLEKKST